MSAESRPVELEAAGVKSISSDVQTPRNGGKAQTQRSRHEDRASGAYRACLSCRTTKQKCDGMLPCSNCAASHVVCDQKTLGPPASRSLHSSISKRRRHESLFDESNEDEEESIGENIPRKRSHIVNSEPRLFVCPFNKHDPAKYNKSVDKRYKTCSVGFTGIARLKEHCHRTHLAPPTCPRCRESFSSEANLESHLIKAKACSVKSTRSDINFITKEQENTLRQRSRTAKTAEEKWGQIYSILYPDEPIPSPYFETVQSFSTPVDGTFSKRLDDVIQSILWREASYLSDTAKTQLGKSLVSGVEGFMKEYAKGDPPSAHLSMKSVTASEKDWSSRPLNNGDAFANADKKSDSSRVFSWGDGTVNSALSHTLLDSNHANNNTDTIEASGARTTLRTSPPPERSSPSLNEQEPALTTAPVTRSTEVLNLMKHWESPENLSTTRDGPFPPHFDEIYSSSTVETERPFECNMCGATFRILSELRKHALMHTRPYKCEIRGCLRNEGFQTASDLERHQKAVHNVISTHDVLWHCASPGCTYSSARGDNFSRHLNRMHPNEDHQALIQRSKSRAVE